MDGGGDRIGMCVVQGTRIDRDWYRRILLKPGIERRIKDVCDVWGDDGSIVLRCVLYVPSISDSSCTRTLMKMREEEVVSVSLSLTYSRQVQGSPSVTGRRGECRKEQSRAVKWRCK
jgi:hypothetical protein